MGKLKSVSSKVKIMDEDREQAVIFPKAKLFQNGRSQAVRLPKEFRFEGSEIGVGRVGNAVILYPLNDPWAIFFEGAEELFRADLKPIARKQEQPKRKFGK
jgi:antitoxin VapB